MLFWISNASKRANHEPSLVLRLEPEDTAAGYLQISRLLLNFLKTTTTSSLHIKETDGPEDELKSTPPSCIKTLDLTNTP